MFKVSWIVLSCLAVGMAASLVKAAPQAAQAQPSTAVTSNSPLLSLPQFLRDIPQLQQKVTLAATDRPLGDVLAELSPSLQTDLRAERDVADQRVTLYLTDQPVYFVMDRLVRLLSHFPDNPHGYHWGQLDHTSAARPVFQLWRDSRSVSEEESARNYPQREIGVMLRDLRNKAGMSSQEQDSYKGDYPYKLTEADEESFVKAFRGLSDDQLDTLAAGQALPLDPALFSDDMAAVRQRQIDQMLHEQKMSVVLNAADPYPHGLPDVLETPPILTVTPTDNGTDDLSDGGLLDAPGQYLVSLGGASYGSLEIDTYDTNKSRSPDRLPLPHDSGPVVDLTPLLTAKDVTHAQRSDVGFTLQVLARAAHITVYQEDFLHSSAPPEPSDPAPGDPGIGLHPLKASLPVLIAALCAHWDYQYQKVGDDYLFWSRTWAQDRADDVPERLIAPWRQRLQKQGHWTFDDLAEMAAALSWRQVDLTLIKALPESSPLQNGSYSFLRFVGQLTPDQEQAAFSNGGLPLATLVSWQQEALTQDFGSRLKNVSGDQLGRAVLTLQAQDNPAASDQVFTLNIGTGDACLLRTMIAVPVPPAPAPGTPSQSTGGG